MTPGLGTKAHLRRVEDLLPRLLPGEDQYPQALHRSMRYTLLAPGKRLRPLLAILCGEILGAVPEPILQAGCAVEMVHASSLILDDLPCMDDAALRRGRQTNHLVFGESTALLAALGLLNGAFAVLADLPALGVQAAAAAEAGAVLAAAIGSHGIIAGQVVDLAAATEPADLTTLEYIHSHKTGKLFTACAELGAVLASAHAEERAALARYAKNLGLAFQITDDLLDASADEVTLGKDVRQDRGRTTFVTLCGLEGARALAAELVSHALEALRPLGRRAAVLHEIAGSIGHRAD